MNRFFRALLALCLLLCLLTVSLCPALAEDAGDGATDFVPYDYRAGIVDGKPHYVATTTVQLRVRVEPDENANFMGSFLSGTQVYVLILDSSWCKVQFDESSVGYVLTMYLTDVRAYDPDTGTIGEPADIPIAPTGLLYEATEDFAPNFKAYAVKSVYLTETPDENGHRVEHAAMYDRLLVETFGEDGWAKCRYNGKVGYVPTDCLFKIDRINPYAGDIPGVTYFPLMIVTKHSTDIYEVGDSSKKKPLKTVYPGAVIASREVNADGQYVVDYWRTQGCIDESDVADVIPVVPYDQAQPGDLIAAMTTFYAVGVSTLNYQGRNWNIYLGGTFSSNLVLQPGDVCNQYSVLGPYRKSTGYKSAPIASPHKLVGYGGGTCQVNTTMYNLLIQVPVLVNHRTVHADAGTYYVRKGFDAAVGGGSINMIYTNTLPYAIRLQYMISDGVLTVCMFRDIEE